MPSPVSTIVRTSIVLTGSLVVWEYGMARRALRTAIAVAGAVPDAIGTLASAARGAVDDDLVLAPALGDEELDASTRYDDLEQQFQAPAAPVPPVRRRPTLGSRFEPDADTVPAGLVDELATSDDARLVELERDALTTVGADGRRRRVQTAGVAAQAIAARQVSMREHDIDPS
jgi:hypothetical protein